MNYLDLAVIIFAACGIYIGWRKGLLLSLLAMLRIAVAVPLSYFVGDTYNGVIYENFAREVIIQKINSGLSDSFSADELQSKISEFINAFPSLFAAEDKESILSAINPASQATYITDNFIEPVAKQIIKIFLIVLTFLIFYVITGIILLIIKKQRQKKKLPLHTANSFFGGAFGLLKSAMILMVITAALELLNGTEFYTNYKSYADESMIYKFICEYNPLI